MACVAGTLMILTVSGTAAWAAEGWNYDDTNNTWYYLEIDGQRSCGRLDMAGETYFLNEEGTMLTGWVCCPRDEMPDRYDGTVDSDDLYFCYEDGRMAKGWVETWNPEHAVSYAAGDFQEIQQDGFGKKRYYFDENGKVSRNEMKSIDGKRYLFQEDGVCATGWVYDRGEGAADRYLPVNTDSPQEDKELCRSNPQNLRFASSGDGALAQNRWVDSIPAWDEAGSDSRSFYVDSSGYIVTGHGARGEGASIRTRRKMQKVDGIGTYLLEDWSTDVNLVRVDGKYYCVEDSGTRIDGFVLLTGAGDEEKFPDGMYCFTDSAAMQTGQVLKENVTDDDGSDGYCYYYYFSEKDRNKGQGISGVEHGRLYYQGMAVGAQWETYEVVYLPTLAEKDDSGTGTGFFLVDATGRVMKGSKGGAEYKSSDGNVYRVTKSSDRNDKYGYVIDYYDGDRDADHHKIWKSLREGDYDYLCWDAVEE